MEGAMLAMAGALPMFLAHFRVGVLSFSPQASPGEVRALWSSPTQCYKVPLELLSGLPPEIRPVINQARPSPFS